MTLDDIRQEDPRFYEHWIAAFAEAREIAWKLQYRGYFVRQPSDGALAISTIKAAATDAEWVRLMEHATCLACLDGNAFEATIESYVSDAYENMRANGCNPVAALTHQAASE